MSNLWNKANPCPQDFAQHVSQDGWIMGWHGCLFVPGHALGKFSAVKLLASIIETGVEQGSLLGRGTFWIVLREPSGRLHHLVDPCGLQRIFFSDKAVFGSYSFGLKSLGITLATCAEEGLVEFLNFGRFGAGFSHHPALRALSGSDRLEIGPDGALKLFNRRLPALGFDPGQRPEEFFEGMATSLQSSKVSVDLTGGLDSRLIAGLLSYFGLRFETGLSGAQHYSEFARAEEVSARLDRRFRRYGHDLEQISEELRSQIRRSEGLVDVVGTHRASLMQEARRAEGFDLVIGGVGGENFNDYTLVQDLPWIGRRQANLERFFDLRLNALQFPESLLEPPFAQAQNGFRERMLNRLQSYRAGRAVDTYLNIFYRHRVGPASAVQVSATQRLGMGHLMPLMDYQLFCFAYRMPLSDRVASAWHRRLIRSHAPLLAGMPSTSGIAAHPGSLGFLRDWSSYARNTAKRGLRKAEQRLLKRAYPQETPDNMDLRMCLRATPLAAEAFERVKAAGILRADLTLSELPDFWLGKVVTLGLFGELLEA
jgi:hypothetical protein